MTNDNLFIAILPMMNLSISLAMPRASLVSSNNFPSQATTWYEKLSQNKIKGKMHKIAINIIITHPFDFTEDIRDVCKTLSQCHYFSCDTILSINYFTLKTYIYRNINHIKTSINTQYIYFTHHIFLKMFCIKSRMWQMLLVCFYACLHMFLLQFSGSVASLFSFYTWCVSLGFGLWPIFVFF